MNHAISRSPVPMSGAGMSLLGADDRDQLGGVAAREALELADAELARRAAHAALRAAVGQAEQRALPRHPHRERRALAERDVGAVAKAALRRAHRQRVLDAVAGQAERTSPESIRTGKFTTSERRGSAQPGDELRVELEQLAPRGRTGRTRSGRARSPTRARARPGRRPRIVPVAIVANVPPARCAGTAAATDRRGAIRRSPRGHRLARSTIRSTSPYATASSGVM